MMLDRILTSSGAEAEQRRRCAAGGTTIFSLRAAASSERAPLSSVNTSARGQRLSLCGVLGSSTRVPTAGGIACPPRPRARPAALARRRKGARLMGTCTTGAALTKVGERPAMLHSAQKRRGRRGHGAHSCCVRRCCCSAASCASRKEAGRTPQQTKRKRTDWAAWCRRRRRRRRTDCLVPPPVAPWRGRRTAPGVDLRRSQRRRRPRLAARSRG